MKLEEMPELKVGELVEIGYQSGHRLDFINFEVFYFHRIDPHITEPERIERRDLGKDIFQIVRDDKGPGIVVHKHAKSSRHTKPSREPDKHEDYFDIAVIYLFKIFSIRPLQIDNDRRKDLDFIIPPTPSPRYF